MKWIIVALSLVVGSGAFGGPIKQADVKYCPLYEPWVGGSDNSAAYDAWKRRELDPYFECLRRVLEGVKKKEGRIR